MLQLLLDDPVFAGKVCVKKALFTRRKQVRLHWQGSNRVRNGY